MIRCCSAWRLTSPVIFLLFILISACNSSTLKNASTEEAAKIEVSWQLISNFIEPAQQMEAKFVFTNKGEFTLRDSAWALFFNNTPRGIRNMPSAQPATLSHINGDWYKLTPNKGFSLKPGETLEVVYRCDDFVIKETDAPQGLYFVFYDGEKEQSVVDLGDAKVLPFTTKEQLLRGKGDKEPVHTAELDFSRNELLSAIPATQLIPIIPEPVRYTVGKETFTLNESTQIYAVAGLENEAALLQEKLKAFTGIDCKKSNTPNATNVIRLTNKKITVNGIGKEAYQLDVTKDGVDIAGNDAAGVFYGVQSLMALIPLDAIQKKQASVSIPTIHVEDAPRFGFRGMHLDVGRNFQSKETIIRILDMLSFYKINSMLFCITEDEGWRVEIDGLPELTEVGAVRKHQQAKESPGLHPAYGSGSGATENHGKGYYSKSDFVEILKYAAARHIRVIPEVNLPGHARAAIKSMEARYEKLSKVGKQKEAEEYRLIDPADTSKYFSAQGYKDDVVDVTRPSVYHFYEKVVDELAKLYTTAGIKLEVIHMGGDEVATGAWSGSAAAVEKFSKDSSMETYKNFHSYLTRNLLPLLKKRNLEAHAWEEAALFYKKNGGYIPNPEFSGGKLVPYIWNNVYDPDLGYRIANAGYPVVLCNVTNFYFDLAYNNSPEEPGQYWAGFVDTRDAFTFDPYNMFNTTYTNAMGDPMVFRNVEKLKASSRKNILGVQAQLWAETIKGREMMEYDMLPKLFGYAQSAWCMVRPWENMEDSMQREKVVHSSWNIFANSIAAKDLPRLSYLNGGYQYRVPPPGVVIRDGEMKANAAFPGLTIRYTTDGTDPVINSIEFKGVVKVSGKVKVRCFDASGKGGRIVSL